MSDKPGSNIEKKKLCSRPNIDDNNLQVYGIVMKSMLYGTDSRALLLRSCRKKLRASERTERAVRNSVVFVKGGHEFLDRFAHLIRD